MRQRRPVCRLLPVLIGMLSLLAVLGCTHKPAYIQGRSTDVPQRWQVEGVDLARLSEDQRHALERRGPPTYVRFFREVETRQPVHAWIYAADGDAVEVVWFVDGRQVSDIAVDSDPSAFSSTTRRRARYAALIGTGAALLPAIFLLSD